MELYAPIQKEEKKAYLAAYFQENKEAIKVQYNIMRKKRRQTPEGREKYNASMRELRRRKKAQKAAESAESEN